MSAIVSDVPGHRKVTPIPIDEVFASLRADSPEYRAAVDEGALAGTLGLALLRYRLAHGMTQTALGAMLGMTQPQVSRTEAGEHTPDFATLTRICDALSLEIDVRIGPRTGSARAEPRARRSTIAATAGEQVAVEVREARRPRTATA